METPFIIQYPTFSFINQDSQVVTKRNLCWKKPISLISFLSIAPLFAQKQPSKCCGFMINLKNDDRLLLAAHSIDPKRDTVGALKRYARNLDVTSDKWHFLTGDKYELKDIANDYFNTAFEDPDAPGGFDHSGRFILVDKNRHIRSFCQGTEPEEVDRFMDDIQNLLNEENIVKK